jgi:3-oxoacyl-[acyl-carrier protein] reductase
MNTIEPKKKILITGIAGDIGKFIAIQFAKKNWLVIGLDKNKLVLNEQFPNIEFLDCDLINPIETETKIKDLIIKHSAFDVVINCAGMIANAPIASIKEGEIESHSFELWDTIIQANLYTTFNVSAVVIKHMISERNKGVIINISSIIANGNAGQTAYSAAKAGVNGFTKALAKEVGKFGIRVVGIAPGFFDTNSTLQNISEEKLSNIKASVPLKKLGQLKDIVKTIEYVIDTEYINGKIIELDGGLVL